MYIREYAQMAEFLPTGRQGYTRPNMGRDYRKKIKVSNQN